MRVAICYLAVATLSLCLGVGAIRRDAWKKINDYLIEVRPGDDSISVGEAFANLEAAKMALQNKELKLDSSALKSLISLSRISDDERKPKCNLKSLAVFKAFEDATGLRTIWRDGLTTITTLTRISRILRVLSHHHAMVCRDVYNQRWEGKDGQMLITLRRSINAFEPGNFSCRRSDRSCITWLINRGLQFIHDLPAAHSALKELAKENPDAKYLNNVTEGWLRHDINVKKFTGLYQRYLIAPCKEYLELMADPFEVIRYDTRALTGDEYADIVDNTENSLGFFKAWAHFTICDELMGVESDFLASLIKFARDLN